MADASVVPEIDELMACVKSIKKENPDMGVSKVHKAVKEQNPTWQCSEDRVKKILSEMVVLGPDGKPLKKGAVKKSDTAQSARELAKKKTEAALAKKREELKANKGKVKAEGPVGGASAEVSRPTGDQSW